MKLTNSQAKQISELINSLTVWNSAIQRNTNTEEVIEMMGWHDEVADKLEALGIDVVRYKHPETA
jgi:hypothetical protein